MMIRSFFMISGLPAMVVLFIAFGLVEPPWHLPIFGVALAVGMYLTQEVADE